MLLPILLVLAGIVVGLVVLIATRPAGFLVSRSVRIAAPAEVVFGHLRDLRAWSGWNPFERNDPAARLTYGATTSGVGGTYHFAGPRSGEGRMTITGVEENARLEVRAEFLKPLRATNRIEFTVEPDGGATRVTWAMSGRNGFMFKAFSLVMSMDRMVGGEFEKGLAELGRLAETAASRPRRSVPGSVVAASQED